MLLSSPSYKTPRWTGPPSSSSTLPLRQRLAIEALPPDTLRRLPPVPIVAAADGAVVHLHIDSGWDDRRSGEAIWTCRMGRGRGDSKEGLRKAGNEALPRAPLFLEKWRTEAKKWWSSGSRSGRTDLFTDMHRWACFCNTKALLLVSPSPLTRSALHPNVP